MDKSDSLIIKALQADGRSTVKEISKKTGIRPSTVHQRMKKLKKNGIIKKFSVKLDSSKIDEGLMVFMLVKTKPSALIDAKTLGDAHIKEVSGVTGEYDLLLKLKFKDVTEFNDFIIRFRREQKIETTLTMVSTASIKDDC